MRITHTRPMIRHDTAENRPTGSPFGSRFGSRFGAVRESGMCVLPELSFFSGGRDNAV
jgi:hypothetical protein